MCILKGCGKEFSYSGNASATCCLSTPSPPSCNGLSDILPPQYLFISSEHSDTSLGCIMYCRPACYVPAHLLSGSLASVVCSTLMLPRCVVINFFSAILRNADLHFSPQSLCLPSLTPMADAQCLCWNHSLVYTNQCAFFSHC